MKFLFMIFLVLFAAVVILTPLSCHLDFYVWVLRGTVSFFCMQSSEFALGRVSPLYDKLIYEPCLSFVVVNKPEMTGSISLVNR